MPGKSVLGILSISSDPPFLLKDTYNLQVKNNDIKATGLNMMFKITDRRRLSYDSLQL